jgi:RNA polymerase sigma factor (TIGR02999 family)
MDREPAEVAAFMEGLRRGDAKAAGELVALFYPELRRLAGAQMRREGPRHTWQPTVLVNQLYLELVKIRALRENEKSSADDRTAFLRLSAHIMKRLLIHHSRPLAKRMEIRNISEGFDLRDDGAENLKLVEDLLLDLERMDPLFRSIAEMKALEGLSMEEIAHRLDMPVRTIYRRWTFVRAWLAEHLPDAR